MSTCRREARRSALSQAAAESVAAYSRDSTAFYRHTDSLDRAKAERAHRDSIAFLALRDSMTALESTRTDVDLFRLGQLKLRALDFKWLDPASPGRGYALDHAREYLGNEVGGDFIYTGIQWRTLIDSYPTSPLVDDAAWAMARISQGGECEESLTCFLDRTLTPYADFLARFPDSPHADSAAAKANHGLATVLGVLDPDSLRGWVFDDYRSPFVASMLAGYQAIAMRLREPYRTTGLDLTARLRARLSELQGAKH